MEEAARRRAGGAFAVGVVDAAVTGAHEQARLGEPLHRAAQVGAVDGEDQKLVPLRLVRLVLVPTLVADVDPGMSHHAVPRLADRVVEGHQARLVRREVRDRPQGHPIDRGLPRPEEVADEGDAHQRRGDGAQPVSQPAEERAPPGRGSAGGAGLETVSIALSLLLRQKRHLPLAGPPCLQYARSATRSSISAEVSGRKSAGRPALPS